MTGGKDIAKELDMDVVPRTATILSFPARLELALDGDSSRHSKSGSAEIIIFPGVRIEHWDADAEERRNVWQQSPASPVVRDVLDLLD